MKNKENLYLIILYVVGYIFTASLKFYVPEHIRPFVFLVGLFALFYAYFSIIKPPVPNELAKRLSFILGVATALIILIEHIIITFDISYKSAIVLFGAVVFPFLTSFFYSKRKNEI